LLSPTDFVSGKRLAKRRQRQGRLRCGIRLADGAHPWVTRSWFFSVVEVMPNRLRFGGDDLVLTGPVSAQIRSPTRREWHFDDDWRMLQLTTGRATVEWALPEWQIEWALTRLSDNP
jgi:hypothetical protein